MFKRIAWLLLPLWLVSLPGCAFCIGGAAAGMVGYSLAEKGKWPPPPNKAGYPHPQQGDREK